MHRRRGRTPPLKHFVAELWSDCLGVPVRMGHFPLPFFPPWKGTSLTNVRGVEEIEPVGTVATKLEFSCDDTRVTPYEDQAGAAHTKTELAPIVEILSPLLYYIHSYCST